MSEIEREVSESFSFFMPLSTLQYESMNEQMKKYQ